MRKRFRLGVRRRSVKGMVALLGFGLVVLAAAGGGVYAALGGFAQTSTSNDINLQKGLTGWWKLNGNAKDSTPYASDATVTGAVSAADREGNATGAYQYNGTSDHMSVAKYAAYTYGTSDISVSVWMKATAVSANQDLVSKRGTGTAGSNPGWGIRLSGANVGLEYDDGTTNAKAGNAFTGCTVTANQWYLVTVTIQHGGTATCYLNGQAKGTQSLSAIGDVTNATRQLWFGEAPTNVYPFGGSLDDIRIYNRLLSAGEVAVLAKEYDAQVNAASGESGLVGWWKLDGNTKDSTPNADNGTAVNASSTTDRKNSNNAAYSFNGTSSYVSIADNPALAAKYMTVTSWVYQTAIHNTASIYNRRTLGTNLGGTTMETSNTGTGSINCYFYISGLWKNVQTTAVVPLNQWTMVTCSYDGSTIKAYINGVLSGSTSVAGTINQPASPQVVIGKNVASTAYWQGSIDDVRVYNRALSPSELSNLYNSYNSQINLNSSPSNSTTAGNINAGLVGYWPFNGNAKDATPYQHNGTLTGTTQVADRRGRSNSAYGFNGTSDYIGTGQSLMNSLPGWTMSGWVYLNGSQPSRAGPFGQNDAVETNITSGNTLGLWAGGHALTTTITVSQWHLVTGTWDGTTMKLFIDGSSIGSVATSYTNTVYNFNIGGGGVADPTGNWFNGYVDDVRIYNRALSTVEVAALYSAYY